MSTTEAAVEAAPESEISEPKEPKVIPAVKGAAAATGRGLHTVGKVTADANLRSLGKGLKSLGRKIPVKVRFERQPEPTES